MQTRTVCDLAQAHSPRLTHPLITRLDAAQILLAQRHRPVSGVAHAVRITAEIAPLRTIIEVFEVVGDGVFEQYVTPTTNLLG